MSIKRKIKAFTIIELVATIFFMSLTTFLVLSITFKKDKIPKKVVSDIKNEAVCFVGSSYSTENPTYLNYDSTNGYCEIDITKIPELSSKEFITITLFGAGAKTDDTSKCAGSGEEKVVIYPSLVMPFKRVNQRACDSPMCEKCNSSTGECEQCVKGYKLNNGTCDVNFVYRAYIGASNTIGGQTEFVVVDNTTGEEIVLEVASGGTIASRACSEQENAQKSSSTRESGSRGKDGEVKLSW